MQSSYLLGPSSSDGGHSVFLPSRRPPSLFGVWRGRCRRSAGPVAAGGAVDGNDQDHYAILGLLQSASTAEVKRAYRLLARKYHPDVSKQLQAPEVFKSIRLAYEVLSDEVTRAKYDAMLEFRRATDEPWRERWSTRSDDRRRMLHLWEKLRRRTHLHRQASSGNNHTLGDERGSFIEVLHFSLFTLFLMQTIGYRAALTFCGVSALFDKRLDAGYKMGFAVAWILGGWGGVLLALCIYFTSWLCGKNSSSLVVLVMVALWVGANLAPIPQGAVLTLLYMSVKLQVDS